MNHIPFTYHCVDADGDRGEQNYDIYWTTEYAIDAIRDKMLDYIKHINPDEDEIHFAFYFNDDWHKFHHIDE